MASRFAKSIISLFALLGVIYLIGVDPGFAAELPLQNAAPEKIPFKTDKEAVSNALSNIVIIFVTLLVLFTAGYFVNKKLKLSDRFVFTHHGQGGVQIVMTKRLTAHTTFIHLSIDGVDYKFIESRATIHKISSDPQ